MDVLIIDNNDSFTYNLAQIVEGVKGTNLTVLSYDTLDLDKILCFDKIIISPGPGLPEDFPKYNEWIPALEDKIPVLGICMGLEIIATYYGAHLVSMKEVQHGIKKKISINKDQKIFSGMEDEIYVGLYHSWKVSNKMLPEVFSVISEDASSNIMALAHKEFDFIGLQFHPESYMTPWGNRIIRNWLVS